MHDRKPLASQGSISFETCDCGTVYFHLGPMTLRLNDLGLANLAAAANLAQQRYRSRGLAPQAVQSPLAEA